MSEEMLDYTETKSHVFVTAEGKRIPTRKFSPFLLEKIRNSVEFPAVPTYVVKTVSGTDEIHEHTEDTLETDADRQAWAEYKAKEQEANAQVVRKMLNLVLVKGVDLDLPADTSWIDEQEMIGLSVPTDNLHQLRLHYIETEVITDNEDLGKLLTFVMERIGVRREVIEEAEKSFPDNLPQETIGRVDAEDVVRTNGRPGESGESNRRYQIIDSRVEL